ncbi:hypothetical protein VP1G_01700 [Cytospora mali]|uniref:Uncharacterized protein n=1 Tax=Cytospora mali TaxID=578113 RepID=A0A194US03_CYTMA|nr:hypothetical protein VP1G_01700 [Valsa mali var. pyri (nom. inval.)]
MAPRTDSYTLQMKNLHQRYGLSKNIMHLFTALDEHRRGVSDPDALGRRLRMSRQMRKSCTDTISSLADQMQKNPTPACVAECTMLISGCTDMLKLAKQRVFRKGDDPSSFADPKHPPDEPRQETFFPFMRLPPEIRRRVYQFYFGNLFTSDEPGSVVIIANAKARCQCPPHESRRTMAAPRIKMPLCYAARLIKDEVLAAWFESQLFHFACCCELNDRLKMNANLRNNLKSLRVHWTGNMSAEAFKLLKQVSTLKELTILISKSTTNASPPSLFPNMCVSDREASFRVHFSSRAPPRLCDALGYDELVTLRGLDNVYVEHVQGRQAIRRTYEERHSLELALQANIIG